MNIKTHREKARLIRRRVDAAAIEVIICAARIRDAGKREETLSIRKSAEQKCIPSDASFEIKFINVKYMQMGSGTLEMGLCNRKRCLPVADEYRQQNKKFK